MLRIRQFLRGRDERLWLKILNRAFGEYEDFRPWTLDDFRDWESGPYFDAEGMFIAEVDGKPVGIVEAYIDRKGQEKKGFIRKLGVIPEFRRLGVGRLCLKGPLKGFVMLAWNMLKPLLERGK
jgi:GNAT superfamily N-acetyltransferase